MAKTDLSKKNCMFNIHVASIIKSKLTVRLHTGYIRTTTKLLETIEKQNIKPPACGQRSEHRTPDGWDQAADAAIPSDIFL